MIQQPTTGRSVGAAVLCCSWATWRTSALARAGFSPRARAICFGPLPFSRNDRTWDSS
ncbi:hypothetical protein OG426_26270 [Streptomyces canus]|uniref:hypothetical protein n=1 Tax=Streptomyces canus TaxID=58343 RepID=UPI00225A5918|nr:hypothetical protein [Streptomyces canus]MCX4859065.1 hypothetical protein [Streptomyces canus]WSW35713.1 hypothetical protein OG426_26270 [Streptomyces canus]